MNREIIAVLPMTVLILWLASQFGAQMGHSFSCPTEDSDYCLWQSSEGKFYINLNQSGDFQ